MKENKKPILSICIPTRNRWYSLQYTLKSIIDQEEFKSWDVEIVISDNVSTDETEFEVWKLCKKYKNIRYFRNKENIGGMPNIFKVLTLWKWEYLWLFGSDDLLSNSALNIMIKAIKTYNARLILCSRCSIEKLNKLDNKEINNKIMNFNWFSDFSTYLWYQDNNTHHKDTYFTFMSTHCFRRESFFESYNFMLEKLKIPEDKIKLHSFSFSFIWFVWIQNSDLITIIDKPCLVWYWTNNSWNLNKKIVKDLKQEMKFLVDTYPISKNWKKIMWKIYFCWRMCLYVVPYVNWMLKIPVLKNIYWFFSKKHIKNMWIK